MAGKEEESPAAAWRFIASKGVLGMQAVLALDDGGEGWSLKDLSVSVGLPRKDVMARLGEMERRGWVRQVEGRYALTDRGTTAWHAVVGLLQMPGKPAGNGVARCLLIQRGDCRNCGMTDVTHQDLQDCRTAWELKVHALGEQLVHARAKAKELRRAASGEKR